LPSSPQNGVASFFSAEFDPENAEPVATFFADEGEYRYQADLT
jgi:hypothetical protein